MRAFSQFLFIVAASVSFTACATFNSLPHTTPKVFSKNIPQTAPKGAYMAVDTRADMAAFAQIFVGIRYQYAGQCPYDGFDCSGFTAYVMKGFGIILSPASAVQATTGKLVPLDQVMAGDLLFFGESTKKIQHVAMVVKRDKNGITCVHSTSSRGVMVENVSLSTYWKPKILFARNVIYGK